MNLQRTAGPDPWSIRKLARDETCRMDLGSVKAHVGKPCALAGQGLDINPPGSSRGQAGKPTSLTGHKVWDIIRI